MMSATTVKINRMHKKLDSISGLDGPFVQERLDKIENLLNKLVDEIDEHEKEDELNCTIFEESGMII